MKKCTGIMSGFMALCMSVALVVPASASNMNADPDVCTGSGVSTLVGVAGNSARVTTNIGKCGGEWNSLLDWGRAYTEVWSWGNATYLYAKAVVTADGQAAQTKTASSTNSNDPVRTDKIYQSETEGRLLKCTHTVRGYWGDPADNDYKNESYSGEFEF